MPLEVDATVTSSRKKEPFSCAKVIVALPAAVMEAVNSLNAPFVIVTEAGSIVPPATVNDNLVPDFVLLNAPALKVS